ncbi:YraN family protein [Bacteroidota bacterium]
MADKSQYQKSTRKKGAEAETLACKYIEEKGFIIIKRNFHFGIVGEIDIIAKDKEVLVFVEVKARSSDTYGSPLDSITPKKQKNLKRVSEGYYYINKLKDQECRFDVITIDYSKGTPDIEHLVNAFY